MNKIYANFNYMYAEIINISTKSDRPDITFGVNLCENRALIMLCNPVTFLYVLTVIYNIIRWLSDGPCLCYNI